MISVTDIINKLKSHDLIQTQIDIDDSTSYFNLQTDSRKITNDSVFVCITGFVVDGHNYAQSAVDNGAKLVITEKELEIEIPQIIVANTRKATAILTALFFDEPSKKLKLIGITGTNGKTTIANILERILLENDRKVGLIGTLGYSINGVNYKSDRTTPDIIDLNSIFCEMIEENVEFVVMEVSSHAIKLDRIYALIFHSAVFTNLTQDHLDFHNSMDEYAKTKYKLFTHTERAFINIDDEYGRSLYNQLSLEKCGISFEESDISIGKHDFKITGSTFNIKFKDNEYKFETSLIGKYNIFNIAVAFSVALDLLGAEKAPLIINSIQKINFILGRLQSIPNNRKIGVYVDYAHTPDALENVLRTLNEIKQKNIICVFGAGGNRDKTKRSKMLKAAKVADRIFITNDNPRDEDPSEIIRDIIKDANKNVKFWIIRDRKRAIQTAIDFAKENDIVLIAGKGHEQYQEIKGNKFDFNDVEEASNALSHSYDNKDHLSLPIDPLQLEQVFNQKMDIGNDDLIDNISTDSRSIKENSLFFALKGDNFDGHDYVENIIKQKNCWAIVNDDYKSSSLNTIPVKDTLKAYGLLAKKYKDQFDITTIALTGSFGKTTMKEYLYNILSEVAPTHKTFGNENNLIGVPKTIFQLRANYKYSVLELGTNQFGEIKELAEITDPDIGVIISIGASHLEFLKNEAGVFKEKSALLRRDLKYKFFPADDNRFKEFSGITFGSSEQADFKFSDIHTKNCITFFRVNETKFSIPTPYKKFSFNAGIAVSIASTLHINNKTIHEGLQKELNISHRMEIIEENGRTLLVDCYNANPDSMKAAIEFWFDHEMEKPHYAILGDMLELGKNSEELHAEMLNELNKKKYDQLISVGNLSRVFNADKHFEDVDKLLLSGVLANIPENAVILIKASHGIKLAKIIGRI